MSILLCGICPSFPYFFQYKHFYVPVFGYCDGFCGRFLFRNDLSYSPIFRIHISFILLVIFTINHIFLAYNTIPPLFLIVKRQ